MSMNDQLNKAVRSGDIEKAKLLVQNGADVNMILGMQGTPLCAAISANQVEAVKFLIDVKCDLNGRDYDGETALCLALRKNSASIAELLIYAGCNVNREDPLTKSPPIIIAINHGLAQTVQLLIDSGCDVNKPDGKGFSALHHAVNRGQHKIVELLIKAKKSKLNKRNEAGDTPLHLAVRREDRKSVELLLDTLYLDTDTLYVSGFPGDLSLETKKNMMICDLNRRNHVDHNTALHIAVCCSNEELTEVLLDAGCDVSPVNFETVTPLHQACLLGNRQIALKLLDRGALVNPEKLSSLRMHAVRKPLASPLHMAVHNCDLVIVKKLLECGADVNARNLKGESPLYIALKTPRSVQSDAVVDCLINRQDVDLSSLTNAGQSFFHALFNTHRFADTKKLVRHGCDINTGPLLPLHKAVELGFFHAVEEFLNNGADPNLRNEHDMTALHLCALDEPDLQIAKCLIANGADVNAIKEGETSRMSYAMFLSLLNSNMPLINLLLSAGCETSFMLWGTESEDKEAMEDIDCALEDEPELFVMLKEMACTPRSLFSLTSLCIRNYFVKNGLKMALVEQLNLPQSIKDCITMKSLLNDNFS